MEKNTEELEKLRLQILEELRKEYVLTPIKEKQFSVSDILEKYINDICKKCDVPNDYSNRQGIYQAIRKVVCLHFGTYQLKYLDKDERIQFREEVERFIKEYILGGK